MYRLLYRFQTGPEILRRLPSVRLSFPSQGLGRAESRENREGAPGRQVGLRAAARGLETDGPELPPHRASGPGLPSSRGVVPASTPALDDSWPWKVGLSPPGTSKSQAQGHVCASEEPLMQSGACRTPVPDNPVSRCRWRGTSCPQTLSSVWAPCISSHRGGRPVPRVSPAPHVLLSFPPLDLRPSHGSLDLGLYVCLAGGRGSR